MEEDEYEDSCNNKKWLDFSVYPYVKVEIDAQTMWNKLKELYEHV